MSTFNVKVRGAAELRIALRPLQISDAGDIFDIWSDPEVMRFYDLAPLVAIDQAQQLVAGMVQDLVEAKGVRWAILLTESNRLIGTCGFMLNHNFHSATLGFELARRYWRQGLMREALDAAIDHAYREWDINRIQTTTNLDNQASSGLLRKLGFVEEGVMRQWGYWQSAFHDVRLFSLIRADRVQSDRLAADA